MVAFLSPRSLWAYPSLGWAFGFGTLGGPEEKSSATHVPLMEKESRSAGGRRTVRCDFLGRDKDCALVSPEVMRQCVW